MESVVLSFGMVAVVVVDADSKFRGVFEELCKILKLVFWPLARGNHKGLGVERFHRFFNKTQTICGNDRGTHESFTTNIKTSQYAWNSAPIDNTDIIRSVAGVGREFKFPMDMKLQPTPALNDDANSALFQYLRHVSCTSKFAHLFYKYLLKNDGNITACEQTPTKFHRHCKLAMLLKHMLPSNHHQRTTLSGNFLIRLLDHLLLQRH